MKNLFIIYVVLTFLLSTLTAYGADNKLPVVIHYNGDNSTPMIFHITGDGGMVRFDEAMAKEYDANGFSFIALNSLKYFFEAKSPVKLAGDVIPLIKSNFEAWKKKDLILVGFSFGAEIIPFLYERLPVELQNKVKLVVLLTPAKTSDFHIHIRDMIGLDKKHETYNVAEETAKIKSSKILAVYGDEEKNISLKNNIQPNLKILYIKGEHGFKDSKTVFELILKELQPAN
jgi:type IV secretory pathway VirJ component